MQQEPCEQGSEHVRHLQFHSDQVEPAVREFLTACLEDGEKAGSGLPDGQTDTGAMDGEWDWRGPARPWLASALGSLASL